MVKKFGRLSLLGVLLATVVSAGAISLKQLSKPAIIPKQCPTSTCKQQSDCGACFCNLDLGGICMSEPLAKNPTRK